TYTGMENGKIRTVCSAILHFKKRPSFSGSGVCLGDRRVLDAHTGYFVPLALPDELVNLAIPRRCPGYPVMLCGPTVYSSPSLFSPPFCCPLAALALELIQVDSTHYWPAPSVVAQFAHADLLAAHIVEVP